MCWLSQEDVPETSCLQPAHASYISVSELAVPSFNATYSCSTHVGREAVTQGHTHQQHDWHQERSKGTVRPGRSSGVILQAAEAATNVDQGILQCCKLQMALGWVHGTTAWHECMHSLLGSQGNTDAHHTRQEGQSIQSARIALGSVGKCRSISEA